jgi:AraC family transcriptional regulator, regulatory protein of adaptative response / DNA-3-methyladenine glycosylase II
MYQMRYHGIVMGRSSVLQPPLPATPTAPRPRRRGGSRKPGEPTTRSENGETRGAANAMDHPMNLDRAACYRALQTHDARFDGRLFIGVRTTGVYCRPICPARCPKLENIEFYASAAAAQEAGFRPCLRCRPESSPDLARWRGTSNTVSRALALIADGALDGDAGVEGLALRLGIGERQLRRLFKTHLGASPIAVAQTRRVLFAKQLIHETRMSMVDVAQAAGFGSLRRFNDTFRRLYARPPSVLRRQSSGVATGASHRAGITLRLSYAPPYDWEAMIDFLAARAIAGVEIVEADRYRRTIEIDGCHGTIEVVPMTGRHALAATIRFPTVRALPMIIARIRRVFDLAADAGAIAAQLAEDSCLAPLVAARPGLRVPGAWDGFELAVRAILGQQVSVTAARQLAAKLVAAYGEPLTPAADGDASGLTAVFPRPERLAAANLATLGMPRPRALALSALAASAAGDARLFDPDQDLDTAVARLRVLPGIGEWTAQYIAMRALREPDAFPAADIGLLRAMSAADGTRPTAAALLARAEVWRPWRAYAAQHLWASGNSRARARLLAAPRVRQEAVA